MKAALLAALLVSPVKAADAPPAAPSAPLVLLADSFSEAAVETLASRGVLVLQGKAASRRLAAIHWKAFGALARATPSCLALASAADALGHEAEPTTPTLDLAACRALPPDGLMTPGLHALAAALEAAHEERWALHLASASPSGVPDKPNVFDTVWGRELIERRHADALENPAALVKPIFDELLAGPRPDKEAAALLAGEAAALLAGEAAARGATAPDVLLAYDGAHGVLSEELRAQLRRTLSNERRRWAAAKALSAAEDLLKRSNVKRELEDLRGIAKSLSSRPNLPAALEAAASRVPAAAGARLKSAGLHLQDPTRLGQHELGDEATVSGAYWVDGLGESESVEVEETLAVDTERGFPSVETRTYKRRNGGPYTYERRVRIEETRPFAVRAMIATPQTAIAERVEVPLGRDFELALGKEAEAAGLRAACRLKDAEAAYGSLETLVAEPAKVKPQYRDLAERARKATDATKTEAESLMKLEEAITAARADSAPQLCRYETGRVDEALKLLNRLPAGCDKDLPELHALRATITRRAADQNWFMKASADARSKRKSCDLGAAKTRWSEALATLEADPAARCGRAAEEESRAKTDFAELTRKLAWRDALNSELAKAEAETAPTKRLELLRPVSARLGALDEDCFGAESRRAATLSAAASRNLTAPADLAKGLPAETALASAVSEVKAERARRLDAAGAVEKASVEVLPGAEEPKAVAPAKPTSAATKKPVKKPAARPKRKTKAPAKGAAAQ